MSFITPRTSFRIHLVLEQFRTPAFQITNIRHRNFRAAAMPNAKFSQGQRVEYKPVGGMLPVSKRLEILEALTVFDA